MVTGTRGPLTRYAPGVYVPCMAPTLRQTLDDRGITQTDLAHRLGVTQATVSRKLAGKTAWHVSELGVLADLLGVSRADVWQLIDDDAA